MVHGNVFLHGWHLPADSYWLLDLPFLGLQSTLGLGPATFHVVPTVVAALTVLLAAAYAARGANLGIAAISAGTTFLIIGLPSSLFAAFFLQGPLHVATTLCCLLAFGLLTPGRSRRSRAGGGFLLLAAMSADAFALLIGVLPVVVAGLAASRTRRRRERSGEGLASVAAGVLAALGGEGLTRLIGAFGGFRRLPTLPIAAPSRWIPNLRLAAHDFLSTFGLRVLPGWPHVAWPVRFAHVAGLALAVPAVAFASFDLLRRLTTGSGRGTWIDDVCVAGFLGSVAFYAAVVFPGENVSRTRYLLPAMVYAAILAGRFAGALAGIVAERASDAGNARVGRTARTVAVAVALVLAAGYGTETVASVRTTNPPNPALALESWLSARHLTNGWGGYWDAALTTVLSHDGVRLHPVIGVHGRLHGFGNFASDSWFSPSSGTGPATFLVYQPGAPWGDVNAATASATFGEPTERVRFGAFEVLIWDHDTRRQLNTVLDR